LYENNFFHILVEATDIAIGKRNDHHRSMMRRGTSTRIPSETRKNKETNRRSKVDTPLNEKCADERILLETVFDNGRKTSIVGLLTVDQYNG
jgi:hypothetical protein